MLFSYEDYLVNVRKEQRSARITPHQADPVVIGGLEVISSYKDKMLLKI